MSNSSTSKLPLHTDDPVALSYLMTESLFDLGEEVGSVAVAEAVEPPAQAAAVAESPAEPAAAEPTAAEPTAAEPTSAPAATPAEITFSGQKDSGILFVFQNPGQAGQHRMPEAEMEAFEKILSALKRSTTAVTLINLAGPQEPTAGQLQEFFQPHKIILLGTQLTLAQADETWPQLQLHHIYSDQNTQILHTFSFSEMMDDVDKKRMFWAQIKMLLG